MFRIKKIHEVIDSAETLASDIDHCIGKLVNARINHDEDAEKKALFQMERLLVDCEQELGFIAEYLKML